MAAALRLFGGGGKARVADSAEATGRSQKPGKVAFAEAGAGGSLLRLSGYENGVDATEVDLGNMTSMESHIDVRKGHRASQLVRRFQNSQAWVTMASDENPKKIHKREAQFFIQVQLENQRARSELLAFTRSFLPNMLVEALESGFWGGLHYDTPALRQSSGSVIVIEIVGMFRLTAYLLQRLNGEMHLSKFLDKFFTLLIAIVASYRGDIVQFTGDSLAIFFEAASDQDYFRNVCGSCSCNHSPPELSCLRATACCLEVHKKLRSFDSGFVDPSCPPISVAIGISTGTVSLIGLTCGRSADGNINYLYTVGGLPVRRATEAAHIADTLDASATVLCPEAWALVDSIVVEGPSLSEHPEFHRLEALDVRQHTYPMVRHAAQLSFMPKINSIKDFDPDAVDLRLGISQSFLHRSIKVAVATGNSGINDESRKVSLAFLIVSGVDATTDEGVDVLAKLAKLLQEASNTQEGYLWKLTVDDCGTVFNFVWGLPPLVHLDDPKRACKACHAMVHVVTEMNLSCKVSIVTARFFCGAIGSATRREYSMIGSAMQVCARMAASAGLNLVLVDSATHQTCCGDLDFVTVDPVLGGPCLEPITVFQLLPPRSGDCIIDLGSYPSSPKTRLASKSASERMTSPNGSVSPMKFPRYSPVVFSPPCTPPWLAKPGRNRLSLTGEEPLFPTLWTSVWCERPTMSPTPPQLNLLSGESKPKHPVINVDSEPWKTQVPVPLPWPARSMACGGVSPVPAFSAWKVFNDVEGRITQIHADRGGLLLLVGPFGSGKTELAEHAVCSAARNKKMLPIFGAMEMRSDHEWAALRGVLRGALALLEPSGQIKSDEVFRNLVAKEAASSQELLALEQAKIIPGPSGKEISSRSPSHWGEKSPLETPNRSVQFEASPRPNSPLQSPRSGPPIEISNNLVGVSNRQSRCDSIASAVMSTYSHTDSRSSSHEIPGDATFILIGIVKRLIQKLLHHSPVVITLRVSQGTARAPIKLSSFWQLVASLEAMALARSPGNHELFIVVACQSAHLESSRGITCSPTAAPILVSALNNTEVTTYIHLCLGLREVSNGSEEPSVPLDFALWLSRFANVPRYIEEALTQLHRSEMIEIIDGKCIIKAPLESIRVADWIHTDMVARVISEAEALSPEKQQILQVASTLQGSFSSLDLAAANRWSAHGTLSPALIMQQCVRKLNACLELTKSGLLRQVGNDWDPQNSEQISTSYQAHPSTQVKNQDAPSWYIPSALIYQVIAATLFQSHRMELKRAILVTRAIRTEQQRMNLHLNRTRSALSANLKKTQPKKRARNFSAPEAQLGKRDDDRDIPISCLVTPLLEHDDEEGSSDSFMSEPDFIESSTKFSHKLSVTSSCAPSALLQDTPPPPRQVDLVEFLPLKCLRRFAQVRLCYSLWIAAFGRELTLMFQGPQDVLDVFLLVAAIFLLWDLLVLVLKSRSYFRNLYIVSDLLITVVIVSDISWALGMDDDDFLVFRRQSSTMIRVVCLFGKFAACICRLSAEIQRVAIWLNNHPCLRRVADGFVRPLKALKGDNKIRSFADDDMAANRRKEQPTAQLAGIANKVANAVLLTLTVFTVLTTGTLWLVDYSYYPDEDLSMQAWVQLVGNYLPSGGNVAGGALPTVLKDEIALFDNFYNDLSYGPFSLCNGHMALPTNDLREVEDRCPNIMWRTPGDQFSQPSQLGFQVDVQSGNLWASFDFTAPARYEATTRFLLLLSLFVLTFGLAVSINIVVTSMVTAPLMRILATVRMISEKLKEQVPGLQDLEAEDEVSMLEQVVGKLANFVTKFNPDNEGKGNEWINGRKAEDQRPQHMSVIVSNWRRRSNKEMDTDCELLAKLDVSIDDVNSWSFNVFMLERFQLEGVTAWLLLRKVDCTEFDLHTEVVANYVRLISCRYPENPYHSWKHAVDVHHTIHRACDALKVQYFLTPLDLFALAVAAIAHDVAHPGYNNTFLEQTSHELALRYNDKSPLENMHCATMFALMQSHPEARIFQGLSKKRYKEARSICVEVILHTDNAKHFDMVKELELFHATNSDIFDRREELDLLKQNRSLVLNAIMHGSDISNACKPWKICMSWADLVLSEFFLQGDEEKRLGMPVLFDRDTVNKPTSQVFFIEIFVLPFYKSLVKIFSPLWQLTDCLQANLQIWHLHRNAEVEMEEDKRQETNRKIAGHSQELQALTDYAQSRSDSVVSKNDQSLKEITKKLQLKTDPFGRLTLEPDIDLQPQVATASGKVHDSPVRKRSTEHRKGSHGRASNGQPPRIRKNSRGSAEENTVPLPGTLSSAAEQVTPLLIHHSPQELALGARSPSVSEMTSLQPGSPPPEQPS